jgi:uncharacterized coiled-coil protein SlyX
LTPLVTQTPLGWFMDLFRTRARQLAILDRQVGEYLETLLFANTNRIANDFDERVLESRRCFQFEILSHLEEIVASTEQALARARERRAQGSRAVQSEVERIRTLSDRLEMLGLKRKVGEP